MSDFIYLIVYYIQNIFNTEVFLYFLASITVFAVIILVLRLAKGWR